jgi:SAM-dependent methyltransferase
VKLYDQLADHWELISPPADYEDEARGYERLLRDGRERERLEALELGCGGGHCVVHMTTFDWTLADVAPAMLALSRRRNPAAQHVLGDMRDMRLGRAFDAVFVHDAVMYMTTELDLEAACRTAFVHCRPGGVALFAPDHVAETFRPGADHGGHDGDGRGVRYLEWVHDLAPGATAVDVDFVFALREGGTVRTLHDRHRWGVFPSDVWLAVLRRVGLPPELHDIGDEEPRRLFVARRPRA